MAYSAKPKPTNTPITMNSGNVLMSQSTPAPNAEPEATPASSRNATDSADAAEARLPFFFPSSG